MNRDFETFFHMHERRIYFQMHRLNIPKHLHSEFYAEGIVALWQAYKNYERDRGEIGTYLNYQIRFRLIDLLRQKVRQQENEEKVVYERKIQLDDGNRNVKSGVPIPKMMDIPLKNQAFWAEVRRHLTENQWKWVKYFVIADLSIKEIMEIEDVSADTVKGWGREARKKLRKEHVRKTLEALL